MASKNGKWVVSAIVLAVLLVSVIALFVQQRINANVGRPPPASAEPAEK